MEIKETQKVDVEVVVDIVCDCCGKSCNVLADVAKIWPDHVGTKEFSYMTLKANWGYFSDDKDLTKWSAQVCEKCIDEKFGFIKFKKENIHISDMFRK